MIPKIDIGNTTFAVRVSPDDPNRIALDFNADPPLVTGHNAATQSAATILATGKLARAVIIDNKPMGLRTEAGVPVNAFLLTVMPEGADPYQVNVGNPTPPAALPFLFPGSHVPVRIGNGPDDVVIDWAQATEDSKSQP